MNKYKRAYLELHIAVLLFGFTAILGDLIQLSAYVMVWWRMLITSISLLFIIRFGKKLQHMPRRLVLAYMGIGVLVALHWITFFGSVKYSNASICLVCMATTSLFTSFLEPLITRQKFKWYEVAIGLIIIPGMMLVVNNTDSAMFFGIILGLISAFLASLFGTLNKKMIDKADPLNITFLELGSGWLFLSIVFPLYLRQMPETTFWPSSTDWFYLAILAFLCTTLAYVLTLRALKHISAFAANLSINLEPVYGILLAIIILKEHHELSPGFYWGCTIIIAAVLGYPFLRSRFEAPVAKELLD